MSRAGFDDDVSFAAFVRYLYEGKEQHMTSGVKVVGAPGPTTKETAAPEETVAVRDDEGTQSTSARAGARRDDRVTTQRRRHRRPVVVPMLAVLGLLGTLVFGLLWAGKGSSAGTDPAMTGAARAFMTDLTNFNAKSIDADFNAITSMATGTFSGQASDFFNSSIRTQLQDALAESRGQIRDLYVQSASARQGSVYVVDDQVYANNKITTPQSDVLRVVVDLAKVGTVWKISDVTVLEGATPASTGSASGSAGSTVPGQ
jgi:hypothetical protein